MSETEHQRTQREARARKRAAREEREAIHAAARRRVERSEVPKEDLLRLLKSEGLVPEAATKIIGTGHGMNILTVIVAFD